MGNGPLPEFEYWHEREAAFSSIVEQLKKPTLVHITELLYIAKSPVIDAFISYQTELKRYYAEARDNVKFLSTIKRHLKVSNCRFVLFEIFQLLVEFGTPCNQNFVFKIK